MNPLVIFSDLDGTLLDHYDYRFDAAISTLNSLKRLNIPCIINTSKTHAELISLQNAMQLDTPFIIENGSAVYIPKNYDLNHSQVTEEIDQYFIKSLGPNRTEILDLLKQLKDSYSFTGFADLNVQELIELTQLSAQSAELALTRDFTEPLLWQDTEIAFTAFQKELAVHGLQTQKGGRFIHVMGKNCDKAKAMQWLSDCYQEHYQRPITTMALGDGYNDVGMISHADIGVIIHSPAHEPPTILNRNDINVTKGYGPIGWAQAVEQVLTERKLNR